MSRASPAPRRLEAISCHRSQTSPYEGLPEDLVEAFLATDRLVPQPAHRGQEVPFESSMLAPTERDTRFSTRS